jgi:peptidoglycan/LPS O-acetylase OafA/YrhL
MRNRVIEFDIVRALAIFFILFHHLPGHSFNFYAFHFKGHLWDLTFLYLLNAYFGLGLFVFISGHLLSKSNPSFEGWRDVKQFILRRYIRIFPLYIVALLLFVAINGRVWDSIGIRDSLNIYSFVLNLLGLQIILGSKYCRPLVTLWFVGLIVSYYYLYIICVKFVRSFIGFITLVFTISLFSALFMHLLGLMDERFLFYLGVFIAGILEAKYKFIEKMKFSHVVFLSLVFVIFVYLYVAFIYPEKIPPVKPSFLSFVGMKAFVLLNLIMLSFVPIVFALAKRIVRTDRYVFLQKIAYASYCMYLFHRPVWWIMVDIYNPANVKFKAAYLALLGIPVTIIVSYYLQKFYDRYFEARLIKGLT